MRGFSFELSDGVLVTVKSGCGQVEAKNDGVEFQMNYCLLCGLNCGPSKNLSHQPLNCVKCEDPKTTCMSFWDCPRTHVSPKAQMEDSLFQTNQKFSE